MEPTEALDLDGVPGALWVPAEAPGPVPLVLLGHPGGLPQMLPRLAGRATALVAQGFAAATIELPGSGERPRLPAVDAARAELREAILSGGRPSEDVVDRVVLPLVERAAPEWQRLLDVLLARPDLGGPVAWSGGLLALGVRLALVEPRVVAAGLFAGSWIPAVTFAEARSITVPVHVLLQWDDEGNDRQQALDLYDALGSAEKTLQANLGGHTGVPAWAGEDAARFYARHLVG